MIESIFGKIVSITNNDMVINVGPINLSILIPSSDKYLSLKNGDDIKISTFLDVKEDSLTLIGFLESNERKLFQKLINVKGVGSKVAISILSTITPDEIIESVASNNHNILKQVSGIGEKTAKLILLQLQGQLDNIPHKTNNLDLDTQIEATQAVQALGYAPDQIKKIINKINLSDQSKQSLTSEELIRIVLDKISMTYD
ncbi:MAG: Holliday junction branch migration protein RuvA [Flavobacteriales bacterium]|nr:Holliday junction branch migration protein RuvA [Flavobacteriales bacterium]|tara:strand:+ start:301 stop:900 length:600 start_codon:yes stop_codon:yes gene_type:complete